MGARRFTRTSTGKIGRVVYTANALFRPDDVHANEEFVDCMHDGVVDLGVLDEIVPSGSQNKRSTIPLAGDFSP